MAFKSTVAKVKKLDLKDQERKLSEYVWKKAKILAFYLLNTHWILMICYDLFWNLKLGNIGMVYTDLWKSRGPVQIKSPLKRFKLIHQKCIKDP